MFSLPSQKTLTLMKNRIEKKMEGANIPKMHLFLDTSETSKPCFLGITFSISTHYPLRRLTLTRCFYGDLLAVTFLYKAKK